MSTFCGANHNCLSAILFLTSHGDQPSKTEFHKLWQCLPFTAPGYENAERKETELQPFISVSSVNTLSSMLEISSDETKTKPDMLDLLALLALAAWSHQHLAFEDRRRTRGPFPLSCSRPETGYLWKDWTNTDWPLSLQFPSKKKEKEGVWNGQACSRGLAPGNAVCPNGLLELRPLEDSDASQGSDF